MSRTRRIALWLTLGYAAATPALASSPSLQAIRPVGGQRGTQVEVTLSGARLGDAQQILWYQPGIETTAIAKVDDNSVKATLKIAPDARLGLYDLRLRTTTGVSEQRTFSVGALPELSEVEPNNDFAAPQAVAFNSTVNGVAENEDVDYFVIEAKKGDRISAEVEGIRLGITLFDPYVAILDAKRFELATSDDAALVWQDGTASVVAPEDGKYVILVRESAYAGNGGCMYRLHVGGFPRARAVMPAGGRPGESLAVRWIGDVLGDTTAQVTLPGSADPTFGLVLQDDKGIAPYPNPFRISTLPNVIEAEPNADHAQANAFDAPAALNGVIGENGDVDTYVFKANQGQVFDLRVLARAIRSPLDPVLYVAKRGGGALAGNDDSAGPDSYLRFQAPETAEFVVWVFDQLLKGGPDYAYRLEVAPVAAKLTLSVPNEALGRGTGVIASAVPKGNRQAILVNAARADFGGDLKIAPEGLPPGVTADLDAMAANLSTIPVLLTAAPDAAPAGALARFVGVPVDPAVQVPSEFAQTTELVLGQNNVPFWVRNVDRFAVTVTDEAPFTIEIVEPKAPLVRGGSMNLKVVAKRKDGFKAPIAVSLPWLPPGVGASGGVSIPESQNEALIPMNADGGAELKTWRVVVNGTSDAGTGPVTVSTQLAKLTIAQQYVTLAFQAAAVEQGKETELAVTVNQTVPFEGEAQVTLIGLPNKVTTEVKTITKESKDLVFHLKTEADSPAGNHQNLFCQVVVPEQGEPVVHNLGTGTLRVDVPLPPKANEPPPPAPAAAAPPPPPAAAPPKPLSRLEQLRLEQAEKAKAAATKAGGS